MINLAEQFSNIFVQRSGGSCVIQYMKFLLFVNKRLALLDSRPSKPRALSLDTTLTHLQAETCPRCYDLGVEVARCSGACALYALVLGFQRRAAAKFLNQKVG